MTTKPVINAQILGLSGCVGREEASTFLRSFRTVACFRHEMSEIFREGDDHRDDVVSALTPSSTRRIAQEMRVNLYIHTKRAKSAT